MTKGKITAPRVYNWVYLNKLQGRLHAQEVVLYKIDYFVLYVCTFCLVLFGFFFVLLFVCLFRVSGFCCLCSLSESENEAGWTERWGGSGGVKG